MDTKSNKVEQPSRARFSRSDLIDLTDLDDKKSINNILDLFDPLSHPEPQDDKKAKDIGRSRPRAEHVQSVGVDRRDRRFRATSACPTLHNTGQSLTPKDSNFNRGSRNFAQETENKPSVARSDTSTELTVSSSDNELSASDASKTSPKPSDDPKQESASCTSSSNSDYINYDTSEAFSDKKDPDGTKGRLRLVRKHQRSGREAVCLTEKLKSFRSQFKYADIQTNPGLVYSPTLYSSKVRDMSVKIVISSPLAPEPINFTCNVSTTIEHLISHAVCSMFEHLKKDDSMDNYLLKVTGKDEYFDSHLCLADYALVTYCWKFDHDVRLTLVRIESVKRPFQRTSKDDFRCKSLLCPDDLLSRTTILKFSHLNYENLNITIETFEREAQRLYFDVTNRTTSLQTQSLLQTTKAICSMMMNCELSLLTESKDNVAELCRSYRCEGESLADEDRYKMIEVIQHAIRRLVENMHRLLVLTSSCLPVDYEVVDKTSPTSGVSGPYSPSKKSFVDTPINLVKEQVSLRVHLVSQLKADWMTKYQEYHLSFKIAHGTSVISDIVSSSSIKADTGFFYRLLYDEDIVINLSYQKLPREARLIITLHGIEYLPSVQANVQAISEHDQTFPMRRASSVSSICSTAPMYNSSPRSSHYGYTAGTNQHKQTAATGTSEPVKVALASSVVYMFDNDLLLIQGDKLLYMHPMELDQSSDDVYLEAICQREDPILVVEFKRFPMEKKIYFPDVMKSSIDELHTIVPIEDYDKLDSGARYVLDGIISEKQHYEQLMSDEKSLLWDNRFHLTKIPAALPKLLQSIPDWSCTTLTGTYALVQSWTPLDAVDAIQLLLPNYPDTFVRQLAVSWIAKQGDDELCDYLPQLLQAFRYEKSLDCPIFWLLIERALKNPRISNLLYWQLKLNSKDAILQDRSEMLINCLLQCCGAAFWKTIDKQEKLLDELTSINNSIKKVRDGQRMSLLMKKLEQFQDHLMEKKPTMPWAPSLEVCDLDLNNCMYFPSNTVPLKLAFRSCEESCGKQIKFYTYDTIFKMGDDLRQDMIALQMIRIMEKLWLREGLDLRMVTFDCLATGDKQGLIEVVQNAETLRKIQQNGSFITGPFNQKAIDNYIRFWNTSELEYKTAIDNFLHSCAGYSVATYILGICDRHNDNIMITTAGHLFHIDYGKFLGDAQMMGSIKRDRTPFVLTADMAYVINGGDKPSKKFQTFIELCTMGFNIIRRHRNLFLNLFSLMKSAKINGLNCESVNYIDKMLMPNLTETEAMAKFTRLINECLSSRSAQVNFFIHNLAQLRFSNDTSKQSLLSFVPKTFTMQIDGRIESLQIVRLYKLYEPEKQYYYEVQVKRYKQPDATIITRTFREFSELQMQLNYMFPSSRFHNINKSTSSFLMDIVGRNNTREIAERRLAELDIFLRNLSTLPEVIRDCDLIYTFFHPILRDQQKASRAAGGPNSSYSCDNNSILNESASSSTTFGSQEYSEAQRNALYLGSTGQVKLRLSYKNGTLIIMMMHAKNLAQLEGAISPNCYAKTYLLPDATKQTKRKTRVVRQNCNPSFMELIVYKIPMQELKRLTLQVSIWHSEIVQYKAFMGAALIPLSKLDLTKETTSWYPLKNF